MQRMNSRLAALRRRFISRLKNETSLDKINRLAQIKSRRKEIFNNDSSKEQDSEGAPLSDQTQIRKKGKTRRRRKKKSSDYVINHEESEQTHYQQVESPESAIDEIPRLQFINASSKRNNVNNIAKVLLMSLLSNYVDKDVNFDSYDDICRREDIWKSVTTKFKEYGFSNSSAFLKKLWKNIIKCTQMNIVEKEKSEDDVELSELDLEMIYFFPGQINEGLDDLRNKVINDDNEMESEFSINLVDGVIKTEPACNDQCDRNIKTEHKNHCGSSAIIQDHSYCYIPSSPESISEPYED